MLKADETIDIFISYRREGARDFAGRLYDKLTNNGYRVFLDEESVKSGRFDEQIIYKIKECTDLLLVIPPNGLEGCKNEDDWIRREFVCAANENKNIIPIFMKDFDFEKVIIPDEMKKLNFFKHQSITYADVFPFIYPVMRIEKYLHSKPTESAIRIKKKYMPVVIMCSIALIAAGFAILRKYKAAKDEKNSFTYVISTVQKDNSSEIITVQSEKAFIENLESNLHKGKTINKTFYYDYDNDGLYEMFSIVKNENFNPQSIEDTNRINEYLWELWFTNKKGSISIKQSNYFMSGKILFSGDSSVFDATIAGAISTNNYIWGVYENDPVETSFYAFMDICEVDTNDNLIFGRTSGVNGKPYFFFIENGRVKEYGSIPVDESYIQQFKNYDKIIDGLLEDDFITSIDGYYRSEKVLTVNVSFKAGNGCRAFYISKDKLVPIKAVRRNENGSVINVSGSNKASTIGAGSPLDGERYCFDKNIAVFPND